jgi:hypothetical protein
MPPTGIHNSPHVTGVARLLAANTTASAAAIT